MIKILDNFGKILSIYIRGLNSAKIITGRFENELSG
jgi:hypothetical protein